MSFFSLLWAGRVGIVVGQVFDLFLFVRSYLFSCSRGWEIVFVDLCVVFFNLWDSSSQVWLSVVSIMAQGVPVIAIAVEVFVYSFALFSNPKFVLAKSEERIASSVGWVVFIDFLNSAIGLCKAETTCVQVYSALYNRG